MMNAAGSVIAGMGFTKDVTKARANSAISTAWRLSTHRSARAIVGLDGRWREVNPALCRLTDYPEATLLSLTFQDITHPDDL